MKNKSKSIPRRLPSIRWMSHCSQVIQGLIKELMIHTFTCNIPQQLKLTRPPYHPTTATLNPTPYPKVGQLLAPTPQQESKRQRGWATIKKRHLFVANSVLQVMLNVNREKGLGLKGFTEFQRGFHISLTSEDKTEVLYIGISVLYFSSDCLKAPYVTTWQDSSRTRCSFIT